MRQKYPPAETQSAGGYFLNYYEIIIELYCVKAREIYSPPPVEPSR